MSKLGEFFRRGEEIKIVPDKQAPRELSVEEKEKMTWENLDKIHAYEATLKKVLELGAQAKNNE
jgi:hypothetical protein